MTDHADTSGRSTSNCLLVQSLFVWGTTKEFTERSVGEIIVSWEKINSWHWRRTFEGIRHGLTVVVYKKPTETRDNERWKGNRFGQGLGVSMEVIPQVIVTSSVYKCHSGNWNWGFVVSSTSFYRQLAY